MAGWFANLLTRLGVEPRGFLALTRAMILRDLRGQHYAAATATKAGSALSPLFLVVGQCLTTSVLCCALLFGRVDVYFFAFVNLTMGLLLLASALVVEFQEVVLDPDDLAVLGHRPVSPRTYSAARFANLLFYFVLMYLSLTVFPLIVGAGLRDAGVWYVPAYLLASLAGGLAVLALVVLLLSAGGTAGKFGGLKQILSWMQIVAILLVFYGGQMVLRDGTASLQVWGAFSPPWVKFLPMTWLARFVEDPTLLGALVLVAVAVLSIAVAVIRLSGLYATMRPVEAAAPASRPMPPERVGGLNGLVGRTPEERVGYWLCLALLRRDGGLAMRCLLAFNLALVALVAGVVIGPFGNPCQGADPAGNVFTVMAFFLVPLAAPALVHNLTYSRDSAGGWPLRAAPVADPLTLALGSVKAIFLWVVLPLCLVLGVTAAVVWGDVLAGVLHAVLAAGLTWVTLLASLWLIARAWLFSLPPARGSSLAVPPLPMFAIGLTLLTAASAHALLATYPAYWIGAFAILPLLAWWLRGRAAANLTRLGGPSS